MKARTCIGSLVACWILLTLPATPVVASPTSLSHQCALTTAAKSIIEESVTRNFLDANWIVGQSHSGGLNDRAFARNLIAWSNSQLSVVTLAQQCVAPERFDRYCEACDGAACSGLERCFQISCVGRNIDAIEAWWRPSPRYTADVGALSGSRIRYLRKPQTRVVYDHRDTDRLLISWSNSDVVSSKIGSRTFNVSSRLRAHGIVGPNGPESADVVVSYPHIARPSSLRTTIDFHIDKKGDVNGTIRSGESTVGWIRHGEGENPPVVQWLGACAGSP